MFKVQALKKQIVYTIILHKKIAKNEFLVQEKNFLCFVDKNKLKISLLKQLFKIISIYKGGL